jgi:hypothetical protein
MPNFALASLILALSGAAASVAFAADSAAQHGSDARSYGNLSRAQVADETLMSRRNGTLRPVGESAEATRPYSPVSNLDRRVVRSETSAARSSGALTPPGEAVAPILVEVFSPIKSREQVKEETRVARTEGMLTPAGEAVWGPRQAASRSGLRAAHAVR